MLLAVLLFAAAAQAATPDGLWTQFQQDYERTYASDADREFRRGVFLQVRCEGRTANSHETPQACSRITK